MVNTFLPLANMGASLAALDMKRLNAQRREAKQIWTALDRKRRGIKAGWQNHPATRMWEGFDDALAAYTNAAIREWVRRGYRNSMEALPERVSFDLPPWFGTEDFHASHRSNLLRKDPVHYGRFGWSEPATLPYVWPV